MKYSFIVLLCAIFLTGCEKTGFYEPDNDGIFPYVMVFAIEGTLDTPNTEITAYALDEDAGEYINFPIYVGDIELGDLYYGSLVTSSEPNEAGLYAFNGWISIPHDFIYENDTLGRCHSTYRLMTDNMSFVVYKDGVVDRNITYLSCREVPTEYDYMYV